MPTNNPNDMELQCQDCGNSFVWTENDQQFYKEKGYTQPKRCKPCREKKKRERNTYEETGSANNSAPRNRGRYK